MAYYFCEVHALHLLFFHKNGLFFTEELELTLPPPRVTTVVVVNAVIDEEKARKEAHRTKPNPQRDMRNIPVCKIA